MYDIFILGDSMKIPNHVAIIVDGNGRWATNRGLSRSHGHKAGAKNLKKLTKHIVKCGVNYISYYIFSTENFKRSDEEVNYLMNLFIDFFKKDFNNLIKENIKIIFSGRRKGLSEKVLKAMDEITSSSKDNTGCVVNFCLNYGSMYEIVDACNDIINKGIKKIDIETFKKHLYQDIPDVDLMIRTGGEIRLSNFMLMQLNYAELYFTETYFPDYDNTCFDETLVEYTRRDRRYGSIDYSKLNK